MIWCCLRKTYIKATVIVVTVVFLCLIIILYKPNRSDVQDVSEEYQVSPVLLIDAGHGGFDGGTVATDGTLEKDMNLSVSLQLCEICRIFGMKTTMTRETDRGLDADTERSIRSRKVSDMKARLALMKRCDPAAFISVHMNHFSDPSVHGAQVFYSTNFEDSMHLAESIQKRLCALDRSHDRPIKAATNAIFLLNNATCPAVLVECGFISNADDFENLSDPLYRNRLSVSLLFGILDSKNTFEK